VSPVRYELDFYIRENSILHSHGRENLKSCNPMSETREMLYNLLTVFDVENMVFNPEQPPLFATEKERYVSYCIVQALSNFCRLQTI
jgi:hypothetical protein